LAFCDWLSIYQDHHGKQLPLINDGAVWAVDANGEIDWRTDKKLDHVGSYDTKIRIKCDGSRVTVDGNISRFDRTDNVFGFSVVECVARVNKLLEQFDLPPFTTQREGHRGQKRVTDAAVITRVDLTENYGTGGIDKLSRLIHYLAGQDKGRRATVHQYGDNGVTWNEGSKYWYEKLYAKHESLGEHVTPHLAEWVREQGIARHEVSLKARYLAQNGLRHIDNWEEADMDNIVYGRFTEVLTRGTAVRSQLEDIPGRLGLLANAWRAGKDLWGDDSYAKSTRRAWRKALLPYGIDIKQPSNVQRLQTRLEVVKIKAVQAPAWYWNKAA